MFREFQIQGHHIANSKVMQLYAPVKLISHWETLRIKRSTHSSNTMTIVTIVYWQAAGLKVRVWITLYISASLTVGGADSKLYPMFFFREL